MIDPLPAIPAPMGDFMAHCEWIALFLAGNRT